MLNMNERIVAMAMQSQERKQEKAKQLAESIEEKQLKILTKQEELKEVLNTIKYSQQHLVECFYEKVEILKELNMMIEEVNAEENKAKKTLVSQLYPELSLDTLKIENDPEILEMLNHGGVSLEDFIELLIELRHELENNMNQ